MISLASSLPPIPSVSEFEQSKFVQLMDLISLVTDPEKARKHLGEIFEARMAWSEAKTDAEQVLKELASERAEHEEFLGKSRAELDAELQAARAKHDSQCNAAMSEVKRKTAEADRLHAQANKDALAAAELRSDLASRIERIQAAMTTGNP